MHWTLPGALELPGVRVALAVLAERRRRVEALAASRALEAPVARVVAEVLPQVEPVIDDSSLR